MQRRYSVIPLSGISASARYYNQAGNSRPVRYIECWLVLNSQSTVVFEYARSEWNGNDDWKPVLSGRWTDPSWAWIDCPTFWTFCCDVAASLGSYCIVIRHSEGFLTTKS